ncbi:MAG TPA: hypothetical protein VI546_01110 [candidate division Zixibacteria bacterium]|nr:hypothetical protein [candidate division Zixibacteria bacterium]
MRMRVYTAAILAVLLFAFSGYGQQKSKPVQNQKATQLEKTKTWSKIF